MSKDFNYGPSFSSPAAGSGGTVAPVYKLADETVNNSAALQADDHLTATFVTGKKYWFAFLVHYTDASIAGAGGLAADLSGTAVLANLVAVAEISGITSVAVISDARFTALGQRVSEAANSEDKPFLRIEGTAEVTTGGTFFLRWAQQVATAANLTALKGSTFRYQEIA